MIELNLTTSCEEHEIIKTYLQENASKELADKINNGVRIEKDGKTLINKKTLDGFMNYAQDEARKIAEKGKNYKAVHHSIVFGWAIHYFEEDSIEGTLYNEDGTEYKPAPVKKPITTPSKSVVIPKKKPETQFSLFDLMEQQDTVKVDSTKPESIDDEEPSEEDIQEAMKIVAEEEMKSKGSPVYQKYIEIQNQYPNYAIVYRLGDFYEVFGENAVKISNELDLTLTGRDCGLKERIPMIGFPYHVADTYIDKILKFTSVVVVDNKDIIVKEQHKATNIDIETGEIFDLTEEEMREFDGDIYEPKYIDDDDDNEIIDTAKSLDKEIMLKLYDILGDDMTIA